MELTSKLPLFPKNLLSEMLEEYYKILKYNQEQKSMKISFVIYTDIESLPEITHNKTCDSNQEDSITLILHNHAACG